MTKARSDEQRLEQLLTDPRIQVKVTERTKLGYVREALATLCRALKLADAWFARLFGCVCLLAWVALTCGAPAPAIGPVRSVVDRAAVSLAIAIFLGWVSSQALETRTALIVEGRVLKWLGSVRHRCQSGWSKRGRNETSRFVVDFFSIPVRHRAAIIESMANMAYNRWPGNATLKARRSFFRNLSMRFPEGIQIGLEFDPSRWQVAPYGYSAIVPMGISSYLKHLGGVVNLFDQPAGFILTRAEIGVGPELQRVALLGDAVASEIAIYILGINVRVGFEATHASRILLKLVKGLRGMLLALPQKTVYLYCATAIPSVMKRIERYGFIYRGKKDFHGNKLYEKDFTPRTPNCRRVARGSGLASIPPASRESRQSPGHNTRIRKSLATVLATEALPPPAPPPPAEVRAPAPLGPTTLLESLACEQRLEVPHRTRTRRPSKR